MVVPRVSVGNVELVVTAANERQATCTAGHPTKRATEEERVSEERNDVVDVSGEPCPARQGSNGIEVDKPQCRPESRARERQLAIGGHELTFRGPLDSSDDLREEGCECDRQQQVNRQAGKSSDDN
jgi:hypothetical protein